MRLGINPFKSEEDRKQDNEVFRAAGSVLHQEVQLYGGHFRWVIPGLLNTSNSLSSGKAQKEGLGYPEQSHSTRGLSFLHMRDGRDFHARSANTLMSREKH